MCLHTNWKAHVACDLNFIVKGERLLKVTGSHVHWKSDNISETVLDRCNNRPQEVIIVYGLSNSSVMMTLSVLEGHSPIASLFKFQLRYFVFMGVARSLCICRACLTSESSIP